jgi:ABC-type spermidine/putrescine transport system permease subunit II
MTANPKCSSPIKPLAIGAASIDDTSVVGSKTTLPIYVFSSIRRGITPETNVIATLVLAVSLTLLIAAQILMWTRNRQRVSS